MRSSYAYTAFDLWSDLRTDYLAGLLIVTLAQELLHVLWYACCFCCYRAIVFVVIAAWHAIILVAWWLWHTGS